MAYVTASREQRRIMCADVQYKSASKRMGIGAENCGLALGCELIFYSDALSARDSTASSYFPFLPLPLDHNVP